jgi:hypothetical protein
MRGGQADVAGQRKLGRPRARGAVEGRDDDLRQRLQRVVEPVGRADQPEDLWLGVARAHGGIEDAHREELGAACRQHDGLDRLVPGQAVHDPLQRLQHVEREAVLVGRPVEGDGRDAVFAAQDDLVRHYLSLVGYMRMKLSRFGMRILGKVCAFISSFSPMIPLRCRRYAVSA